MSAYAYDGWFNGLGLQKQNLDLAEHQYRLWDIENCDTRNDFGIVLSPAFNTCTITPSRGDLSVYFDYLGQLYFVETTTTAPNNTKAFKFTPPDNMGSFSNLGTIGLTPQYIGSVSAIKSYGANIAMIGMPSSGLSAEKPRLFKVNGVGGAITLVATLSTHWSTNIKSRLGDIGGTLHLLAYNSTMSTLQFFLSGQDVGTLQLVASLPTTMGSYLSPMVTDGLTMFAYEPRGVYDFDETPSIIIDTNRSQDLNGVLAMWGVDLLFKNKTSLMKRGLDGSELPSVGYDDEDGLASDKMGEITAMASSWKYLFAAVKGATYSHILAMDRNDKWRYYTRIPTAGIWVQEMFLSDLPDAIDRLWCIFGNSPDVGYFLNPIVNPLQAGTYNYVPSGYFTVPEFDGGMPEEAGAFYGLKINADACDANNFIRCHYGLNGVGVVTTLGNASSLNNAFIYGNPYGIEGHRIQHKFGLARYLASTGTTPVFRSAILNYLKIPSEREAFDFNIDLKETMNEKTRPLEDILAELDTVKSSKVLVPFQYGQIATRAVKMLEAPATEDIREIIKTKQVYQGEREGFLRIRVAEII